MTTIRVGVILLLGTYLKVLESTDSSEYVMSRIRRSAASFYTAIQCCRPGTKVLGDYGDYGCYCGYSGSGTEPLDATDRCCKIHDECWDSLHHNVQMTTKEIFSLSLCGELCISYIMTCDNGNITCSPLSTEYGRKLCECDKAAAECFVHERDSYDPRLLNVDQSVYCSKDTNVAEVLSKLNAKEPRLLKNISTTTSTSTISSKSPMPTTKSDTTDNLTFTALYASKRPSNEVKSTVSLLPVSNTNASVTQSRNIEHTTPSGNSSSKLIPALSIISAIFSLLLTS